MRIGVGQTSVNTGSPTTSRSVSTTVLSKALDGRLGVESAPFMLLNLGVHWAHRQGLAVPLRACLCPLISHAIGGNIGGNKKSYFLIIF